MKETGTYNDFEIIQKILDGQLQLFEILIRRNNPILYKTGRSYHFNHEDTQDLMQDTFLDAFCNLSGFENRSSFKTWIIKIMLNKCYKRQQKFSFKNEISNEIDDKSIPMFTKSLHSDTHSSIMNRELSVVIENAIQRIPFDYRMVFSLREMNGLNTAETAEVLQISESNVKVRLNRAKTMLRKEIERAYTAEDIFEFNLTYCNEMVDWVMREIKEFNP